MRRTIRWRLQRTLVLPLLLVVAMGTTAFAQSPPTVQLPSESGSWRIADPERGRMVTESVRVIIHGVGSFVVEPDDVMTVRPDLFQSGHFSVFDLLVALDASDSIELSYHYDDEMATHVIDAIDGESGWWYRAQYDGGWPERNTHRIDHFPVKDRTHVEFFKERASRIEQLHREFAEEVDRLAAHEGAVIVPRVTIQGHNRERVSFENVVVRSHDTRIDLLQPGTITALDILLSLGESGSLDALGVTWYSSIAGAAPIDHYFVEQIAGSGLDSTAFGSCGFVYEVGYESIRGFAGAHIHIPTDTRILVSPEYAEWFWICL